MATVRASERAMYLVATPLAAPVRTWPNLFASITASSSPVSESLSWTWNREPPGPNPPYHFIPVTPVDLSAAAMKWSIPPPIRIRRLGLFEALPTAWCRNAIFERLDGSVHRQQAVYVVLRQE